MTIDEAIKYAREVAEKNRKLLGVGTIVISNRWINSEDCANEHDQLAEWLEDYKNLKDLPNQYADTLYKKAYEKGINDGIDEFVNLYEKFCNSDIACGDQSCVGKFCPRCFKENYMEKTKEGVEWEHM